MHIYLQESQHDISVFRMVTTHTAHCYNSPDPPFLISPPSISLCSQIFFLFLNIHLFFLPLQVFVCIPSLLIFSASILVLLTKSAFPHLLPLWCFPSAACQWDCCIPTIPTILRALLLFCCSIWRPLSVVYLLLIVKDLCSGPNCIKAASGCWSAYSVM